VANRWMSCFGCIAAIGCLIWQPDEAAAQARQGFGTPSWQYATTHAYDETVSRALALLPSRPQTVIVIDENKTSPALRHKLQGVVAFVPPGESVVCLRMQGTVLRDAERHGGIFDYVLATVIWHEMAHIRGADEAEAQRQEEELWKQFVMQQRVDPRRALPYLSLLRKRRD
jgi:hypothetical protein